MLLLLVAVLGTDAIGGPINIGKM